MSQPSEERPTLPPPPNTQMCADCVVLSEQCALRFDLIDQSLRDLGGKIDTLIRIARVTAESREADHQLLRRIAERLEVDEAKLTLAERRLVELQSNGAGGSIYPPPKEDE